MFCIRMLLPACVLLFCSAVHAEFRAGAATATITPALGSPIIGNFSQPEATHVHDDLFARCIVLDDGSRQIALVVCDLLGLSTGVSQEARELIEKKTGIPSSNVLVCATHTHSATSALGSNRFSLNPPNDEYQSFVARRIADGVQSAKNNLRPAEFAFGTVDIPEHVFNRRWYLKPGKMPENPFGNKNDKVKMNPPAGSQDLVEPAGPTDPQVSILSFRALNGDPIAVLASYSLHYVGGVPTGHISSDYFGVFSLQLAQLVNRPDLDPPFVPILSNGTSGDINNINFREPRGAKAPYEQMRAVAHDVAEKVHQTLKELTYDRDVTLGAVYREPVIGFRHPDDETLAWAEKTIADGPKRPVDLSYIYAMRTRGLNDYPEQAPIPLQVLRIGKLCIGTMPCEVFCEIGLEFKQKCPIQPAYLMSITHGYLGYLPSPRQHELGGYETWYGTNRLEKAASDKMLAELFDMAQQVQSPEEAN